MTNEIGGFFEQEILNGTGGEFHSSGLKLVNGRSALLLLLNSVKPRKVKLPFYSCDALLQPLHQQYIPYEYYKLDKDFLPDVQHIDKNDFFILINYFGLFEERLLKWTKEKGISDFVMDNTQSFFSPDRNYFSFNSARKFFGVTDGAYLFGPINKEFSFTEFRFDSTFLQARKDGRLSEAYVLYKKNEAIHPCGFYQMSSSSELVLNNIDYKKTIKRRQLNFDILAKELEKFNKLGHLKRHDNVPFVYPFLPKKSLDKTNLYAKRIFFPALWEEVTSRATLKYTWEKNLSKDLIPLPIDHRYSDDDMEYIINNIKL